MAIYRSFLYSRAHMDAYVVARGRKGDRVASLHIDFVLLETRSRVQGLEKELRICNMILFYPSSSKKVGTL
jgi:hypothetical protein